MTRPPLARRLGAVLTAVGIALLAVGLFAIADARQAGAPHWQRERAGAWGAAGPAEESARPERAPRREVTRPDFSSWAPTRIEGYLASLAQPGPVVARLRIPRLDLSVPVLEGTGAWSLNRGAGHIEDTARLGGVGNAGIAGHRDGFFRALRHVAPGDEILVDLATGSERYRVAWTRIVDPDDVWVLDATEGPSLTLVTCHPFFFVGPAPRRFIVRADLVDDALAAHEKPGRS